MEIRRPVHYHRNTVKPPAPGKKNTQKRYAHGKLKVMGNPDKIMTYDEKVCATLRCVWCHTAFDNYAIRCRYCGLCQYCGMIIDNGHHCRYCGNRLGEELEGFYGTVKLWQKKGHLEAPQAPSRNVRRVGPREASRALKNVE